MVNQFALGTLSKMRSVFLLKFLWPVQYQACALHSSLLPRLLSIPSLFLSSLRGAQQSLPPLCRSSGFCCQRRTCLHMYRCYPGRRLPVSPVTDINVHSVSSSASRFLMHYAVCFTVADELLSQKNSIHGLLDFSAQHLACAKHTCRSLHNTENEQTQEATKQARTEHKDVFGEHICFYALAEHPSGVNIPGVNCSGFDLSGCVSSGLLAHVQRPRPYRTSYCQEVRS